MPALIIEGKSDETAKGQKDVSVTYADPAALDWELDFCGWFFGFPCQALGKVLV